MRGTLQRNRRLRADALEIYQAGVKVADPKTAVVRHLRGMEWSRYRRIYVVGAGKAGAAMALAAEKVLGRHIAAGLINVKYGHTAALQRIELNECGHPVPDVAGVAGAARIVELARSARRGDLVLCLISGGASALLPLPAPPITLDEKQATTRQLLACGAEIQEMNAVRKHISSIKGGQLAAAAAPATVESLLLSDVVGDRLDVIGSGPTAPDASTFADALECLRKYGILEAVPVSVRERLEAGAAGALDETPKPGAALFRRVRNTIIGSNRIALEATARCARRLGYRPIVLSSEIRGETREIARMHAAIAREIALRGRPLKPPACVITGGETTVTLNGDGLGGRNQEFVLAAAIELAGLPDVVVLSGGTDGTDGPTDAAGAIADSDTLRLNPEAPRFLANHDSYHYFQPLGGLLMTGPTNTNVMDIRILLIGPAR